MKFKFFSILALAGLLLSSCAVDEIPTEGGSINAEMENEHTRTAVTDEGTFTWTAGDQVWLHTTAGSVLGTLSSGAGSSSAKFTYSGFVGEMTGKAIYPYNDGHSVSGDVLNFVLPASYDLGSSLDNTNAAMYGVNVGGTIKFSHLAGVMRFKFKDVPAGVNKFTITLDKKINGTFSADLTADYPVIEASATSADAEKTITLNFNALTAKSDISVYVPLPIGTYNSLELGLYDDSKSVWTYSKSVTNTVNRKSLKLMPVVTLGGSVDGDLEGGDSEKLIDYVDEYGVNHGPGVKIGETVWAPVNCGYHKDDFKYGKLYQWGRKYGQGYDGNLYDGAGILTGQYSDAIAPIINEDGCVSLSVGQNEDNSNVYFRGDRKNWLYSHDNYLWNTGTYDKSIKTEYDPCPTGWRVPSHPELLELTKNHSVWTLDNDNCYGYWFSGDETYNSNVPSVFLPAAGAYCGIFRGWCGIYWSNFSAYGYAECVYLPNNTSEYGYPFHSHNPGEGQSTLQIFYEILNFHVNSCSVRCVQE